MKMKGKLATKKIGIVILVLLLLSGCTNNNQKAKIAMSNLQSFYSNECEADHLLKISDEFDYSANTYTVQVKLDKETIQAYAAAKVSPSEANMIPIILNAWRAEYMEDGDQYKRLSSAMSSEITKSFSECKNTYFIIEFIGYDGETLSTYTWNN